MKKPSLKSLSETLQLSEGTVSRALNNYPDISPSTRKRVKQAAELLGYRPNSNARRLATGKAECVGYILPWRAAHISEPLLAELLDGLSTALGARQWDLLLASADSPEEELATISKLANSNRVSGIVLSRTEKNDRRVALLKKLDFPFVTHGRTEDCADFAWLDIDSEKAFRDATLHLASLGHRRIAHIRGPGDIYSFALRQKGYQDGLEQAGLALDPVLVTTSPDLSHKGGQQAMRLLLALAQPPTAVLCVSDMVAIGALQAIHEAGLTPGRDISVIGYDGLPFGELAHPPLSTLDQPVKEAGQKIAEMLLAVIDGDDPKNQQFLWEARLNRRATDGPRLPAEEKQSLETKGEK